MILRGHAVWLGMQPLSQIIKNKIENDRILVSPPFVETQSVAIRQGGGVQVAYWGGSTEGRVP